MFLTQRLLGSPSGLLLVNPGYLSPPLTLARAQVSGVQSTAINGGNNGLTFYGADVPRFTGPAQRLLIEGQATNLINGMAAPVTQNVTVAAVAHTLSFYGTGSITLSGVATGTLAGTGANNRVTLTFTPTAGTLTLTVSGTVTRAQLEALGFATSYVEVSSGAATRGVDLVSASLASLGVAASGACTVLWSGLMPAAPSASPEGQILFISDGTQDNRYRVTVEASSGNVFVARRTATVESFQYLTGGARPTGTTFRCGMTINGSGRIAASLNGNAVAAVTGGPTSGLTTFNLGSGLGVAPMFGETTSLRILPNSVSDAELQSLTGAMP